MTIDWNHLFTSTEGRIRRRTYWIGLGALLLLQIVVSILFGSGGLLAIVARFLLTLIGFAVIIKRLHDWDKTGWLALVTLIPYIGTVFVIVLGIVEGTRGPNQYGPDPEALPPAGGGGGTPVAETVPANTPVSGEPVTPGTETTRPDPMRPETQAPDAPVAPPRTV